MSVYSLITILEALCINTYTTYKCSKRRKSKAFTLFCLCLLTAAAAAALMYVRAPLPDNGSVLLILFGIVYMAPLYLLYAQPFKHLMIVITSSWIYTMFAFAFSQRLGALLPTTDTGLSVLIVQTLFFTFTLSYYISFVNNIFVTILRYIDGKTTDFLLAISFGWFFIAFLANWIFAVGRPYILEFLLLLVIIINVILTYRLFYRLVSVNTRARELSQITRTDTLTQLNNRECLYEDIRSRISKEQHFTLIFIDLDNFKLINDKYGHDAGDQYLLEFVRTVKGILGTQGVFYRLHGDEFVILSDSLEIEQFCRKLETLKFMNNPNGLAFKGLSLGLSSYPADGDDLSRLMHLADLRMYQRKKERHRYMGAYK